MKILGLSAFYHDSAAALIDNGRIVAAAQEERFTRRKHDASFPARAIRCCLETAGVEAREIDLVAFYDKPFLKFERLLETYLAFAPRGFRSFRMAMPVWVGEKLFQRRLLLEHLRELDPGPDWNARLRFTEHHESHAASAFFPSPFERAAVLTMDGVGEWATTSIAQGAGADLRILKEIHFPHSLGLLYSAFTFYCGFKVNSGEYKLMGLAPYGEPRFADLIREKLIDLREDGSFRLDLDYFNYCTGLTMTHPRFEALFGGPPRGADDPLTQRHMDVAASIQRVTEEAVLRLARHALEVTGETNLCLAGGVALNCVANGLLLREGVAGGLWIQPAAGDAGGALGAALAVHHAAGGARVPEAGDAMQGSFLGPVFDQADVERRLGAAGAVFEVLGEEALRRRAAGALAEGGVLGWFQGRMEFGPRALGARSILGDPRRPEMQSQLNLKIKYRESFRPFAPAVLAEECAAYFALEEESPYMLLVAPVREERRTALPPHARDLTGLDRLKVPRSDIPAVTHVDGSARIQTVDAVRHPAFHALLREFKRQTGCAVLVNTSFNVRGEPIVCTPEDAFACFMNTEMDALAIGNCWLEKTRQDPALGRRGASAFEPD